MGGTYMRHPLRMAVAAAAVAICSNAWAADPVQLKFAFPAPPMSQSNTWGFTPWIDEVNKATGPDLEIKMFAGGALANFNNVLDRTINGVVEISFGITGSYGGQFNRTEVCALPFVTESTVEASVALWRLFKTGVTSM